MSAQHRVPVILTRAKAQAARFASCLPEATYPVFSPLLRIVHLPLDNAPTPEETLLFTSENGVAALVSAGGVRDGQTALCVGEQTRAAAKEAGFAAMSANGAADDLVKFALLREGAFVHVRGVHARGEVSRTLRKAGRACRELILYDQQAQDLCKEAREVLNQGAPSLVPLFSPRTAALFYEACPRADAAHILCLSPAIAEGAANGRYASLTVSSNPNADSLLTALSGRLQAIRLETGGASG